MQHCLYGGEQIFTLFIQTIWKSDSVWNQPLYETNVSHVFLSKNFVRFAIHSAIESNVNRGFVIASQIHLHICIKFKWNIVNIYQTTDCVKTNQKQRTFEFFIAVFFFSFSISFLISAPTVYYNKTDRRIFPFVDSFHFLIIHVTRFL